MRTPTTTTGAAVAVAVAVAVNDGDLFNNGMLIFILTFYPLFVLLFISLVVEEDKRRRSRGRKRETESRARARYDDRLVVVGCANKTSSFVLKIVSEEEDELEIFEQPPTQRFFVFFFLDDE
jgi:hypothetical protein